MLETLISPDLTAFEMTFGLCLSIVHPTDKHVPITCRTVPTNVFDIDLGCMILAIFYMALNERLPL